MAMTRCQKCGDEGHVSWACHRAPAEAKRMLKRHADELAAESAARPIPNKPPAPRAAVRQRQPKPDKRDWKKRKGRR